MLSDCSNTYLPLLSLWIITPHVQSSPPFMTRVVPPCAHPCQSASRVRRLYPRRGCRLVPWIVVGMSWAIPGPSSQSPRFWKKQHRSVCQKPCIISDLQYNSLSPGMNWLEKEMDAAQSVHEVKVFWSAGPTCWTVVTSRSLFDTCR